MPPGLAYRARPQCRRSCYFESKESKAPLCPSTSSASSVRDRRSKSNPSAARLEDAAGAVLLSFEAGLASGGHLSVCHAQLEGECSMVSKLE
jgi:hypothetical protein